MDRRTVIVEITDHAIVRWLEREHRIDIEAIRAHLARTAIGGAELDAAAVQVGRVRLVLQRAEYLVADAPVVAVVTAAPRMFKRLT